MQRFYLPSRGIRALEFCSDIFCNWIKGPTFITKDEIIADQTIVDNDITSSYELNQRPNRLAADTSTLIQRLSGLVYLFFCL